VRQKQQCEERLVRQRKEQREHAQAMAEKEAQCKQAMEIFISLRREAEARQSECEAAENEWNSFRETHGSPDLIRDRLKALDDASRAAGANPDSRMEQLRQLVAEAEQTLEHLRRQHAANEIRKHLKEGETCPVCEQVIRRLPEVSAVSAVDAARELVTMAKSEYDAFRKRFDAWRAARERAAGCTEELLRHGLALEAAVIQARKAHAEAAAAHNEAQHAVTRAQSALELTAARLAGLDREMKQTQDELRHLSVELAKYPDWAPLPLSELEASLEDQNAAKAKRNALIQEKQQLQNAAMESEARQLALKATIQARREEAERADSRSAELRPALQPHLESPMLGADEAEHFTAKLRGIEQQTAAANVAIGKARAEVSQLREQLHVAAEMRKQTEELKREAEICHQLGNLLKADQFIAYIQREALERLAGEASKQLATLSSGNYTLTLSSDRNEFFVVDNWNGGAERPARTLSGGESFLASLSLALAFSQGLAGFGGEQSRSKLDSLFIDEGISSLDSDSLEIAISALEALTVGDRMVGVISHIAELGDRLNARIRVERTASGSRIHVDAGPAAATARA
jgi:exonuclease SbcC